MKRLTAILVAGIFLFAPFSVSAMEMMDDSSMKDVTGQAGVSIVVDDIVLYQESLATTTYWDTDGMTTYRFNSDDDSVSTVGADNATGVEINYGNHTKRLITIDAISPHMTGGEAHFANYTVTGIADTFDTDAFSEEPVDIGILSSADARAASNELNGNTMDPFSGQNEGLTSGLAPLTIDVGTCSSLTGAIAYNTNDPEPENPINTVAGVIIGLPTVEITQYHTQDTRTISVVSEGDPINADKAFIKIEEDGTSRMAVLGGTVEIAPH